MLSYTSHWNTKDATVNKVLEAHLYSKMFTLKVMKGVGRKNVLDVRYLLPTFLTVFIISVCQGFTINSKMNKNHSMGITPGQKCKFKIARERTVWRGWLVLVNATALSFTPVWSSSTEPASDKASEVSLVMTKVSVQNSGKCIFYIILVISHSTPVTTATYKMCVAQTAQWQLIYSESCWSPIISTSP